MLNEDQAEVRVDIESVKSLVVAKLNKLQELKKEKKNFNESLKNILENDHDYGRFLSELELVQKTVKTRKSVLMNTVEANSIQVDRDDVKAEEKELKEELDRLLEVYVSKTGKNEITLSDDRMMIIKHKFSVNQGQLKLF